uniref:Uncharacterized protein n=1 Tax=Rhipicephalus zambeziensis TaxID=60191 RepID=A0A224YAR0_9ACAR
MSAWNVCPWVQDYVPHAFEEEMLLTSNIVFISLVGCKVLFEAFISATSFNENQCLEILRDVLNCLLLAALQICCCTLFLSSIAPNLSCTSRPLPLYFFLALAKAYCRYMVCLIASTYQFAIYCPFQSIVLPHVVFAQ